MRACGVCVRACVSGREVADARRQHDAHPAQRRHLHGAGGRHLAVVPRRPAARRRCLPARLRRLQARAGPAPLASAGWAEKAGPEIRDHNSVKSYIHTCTRLTALFRDYPGEPVPKM